MDIDNMLRKLDAGAELLTQLDDGATGYWFRTPSSDGVLVDEDVGQVDAMALIESGYVDRIELETDGDGVWFEVYAINASGRQRVAQAKVQTAMKLLDRAPDIPPEPGDELPGQVGADDDSGIDLTPLKLALDHIIKSAIVGLDNCVRKIHLATLYRQARSGS